MRRWTFTLAVSIFCVACFLLYSSLEATNNRRKEVYDRGRREVAHLEVKLQRLEDELKENEQLISLVRNNIYKIIGANINAADSSSRLRQWGQDSKQPPVFGKLNETTLQSVLPKDSSSCRLTVSQSTQLPDIQMLDAYQEIPFDNVDGGAWKQGWDVKYKQEDIVSEPKLEVIVVPHSHCDPGWIKTFENYYDTETRHIFDNMVTKLSAADDMKFIYAEVSFFEKWWSSTDDVKRNAVRQLLSRGQLELATGAWVMTDEANAHYFSMADQLIEGNQWLYNQLGVVPKNHWSIDPFGLSSTMAYLVKRANFSSMTIQRVHYSVKKYLAQQRNLEFLWRPIWASDSQADIHTHVMPFYSYDVPHTCGPDPKICCQFDFARLPGGRIGCPWHVPPEVIGKDNIERRALMLQDQYRKKAQLYKTNVLLIPLGDDFRYQTQSEWDNQHSNYAKLFEFMNSKPEWNMHARFGTLNDYWTTMSKRLNDKPSKVPVLTGDFFTYADRDRHYWSGYYTTRPYHKRLDRVLQRYLRGAEILYTLAMNVTQQKMVSGFSFIQLFDAIVTARRNHGLFQHHDGITGTAKDHVMEDYGKRMMDALKGCNGVIAVAGQLLMSKSQSDFRVELSNVPFVMSDLSSMLQGVPVRSVIPPHNQPRLLLLYNSLPFERRELVCFQATTAAVRVEDANGELALMQITPEVSQHTTTMVISSQFYQVCFIAKIPALGLAKYSLLQQALPLPDALSSISSSTHFNVEGFSFKPLGNKNEETVIKGSQYEAAFDSNTGALKRVKCKKCADFTTVDLNFVSYGTADDKGKSGAYLFLPDGPPKKVSKPNAVAVVDGPLFTSVYSAYDDVLHHVRILKSNGIDAQSIQISNEVDIVQRSNYELAMRLSTDVSNVDNTFFTDENGYHMLKRKYLSKLPIQGNFYPLPAAAYIEDAKTRVTLLTGQPLGVGSLVQGELQVVLDRRLSQDDNRGLFQPILDNRRTASTFRLMVEPLNEQPLTNNAKTGYLSLSAHFTSMALLHAPFLLYQKEPQENFNLQASYSPLQSPFPCDMHLVNLRTVQAPEKYDAEEEPRRTPTKAFGMLLHRFGVDCRFDTNLPLECSNSDGQISLEKLFYKPGALSRKVAKTTLSMTQVIEVNDLITPLRLEPMDLTMYRLQWKTDSGV